MRLSKQAGWWTFTFATAIMIMHSTLVVANEARPFEVEAGPAAITLKQFAKQANLGIVFDPREVKDVQTNDVAGLLTPSNALERMLDSTSLVFDQDDETGAIAVTYSFDSIEGATPISSEVSVSSKEVDDFLDGRGGDNAHETNTSMKEKKPKLSGLFKGLLAIMLASSSNLPAQEDKALVLDPFTVEATDRSDIAAVESISATRFASNINELPFMVNVLSEQLIEDLAVTDVKDLIQFAGSVVAGGSNGGFGTTTNNGARLRGFPTSRNLINGFSVGVNFNIAPNSLQRVEVLKGPASLLYGAIPPGGIINFISKRPTAEHRGSVNYTLGTWDFNRIDVDSSGPITDDIRYLVNITHEDREFFSYGTTREAIHINPQIEFDFADKRGNILFDYYHSHVDQAAVNSGPPRTLSTGEDPHGRLAAEVDLNYPVPNFNIRDIGAPQWEESDSLLIQLRYWLSDNYTFRMAFRTQDDDSWRINQATVGHPVFVNNNPGQTAQPITDGTSGVPQWDRQGTFGGSDNLQVNLLATYDLDWGSFQIMPGIDHNTQDSWFWRFRAGTTDENGIRNGNFRSQPKDIYDPSTWMFDAPTGASYLVDDPRTPEYEGPGLLRNNTGNDGSSTDYYIYGSGNFLNDNLIATFGYRESSFDNSLTTTDEVRVPTADEINFGDKLTGSDSIYQYGAVYKLIPDRLHAYGNFAQSFQPQLRTIQLQDDDNNPLDLDLDGDGFNETPLLNDNPRIPADHLFGEGWEVGFKGSFGESSKISYAVAYFTTTNNNIIRNITVGTTPAAYEVWYPNLDAATREAIAALPTTERLDEFQVQSGEEEASGYEFELTYSPTENWDIRTTYTNLDAVLLADPSAPQAQGRILPNSPKHNFNLFTRYAFTDRLEGLFVGGSADALTERFSGAPQSGNAGMRSRPRILYNAFAGYRVQAGDIRYRFQLNIQNVTDEFVTNDNLGSIEPPRSYRFSAGIEF